MEQEHNRELKYKLAAIYTCKDRTNFIRLSKVIVYKSCVDLFLLVQYTTRTFGLALLTRAVVGVAISGLGT